MKKIFYRKLETNQEKEGHLIALRIVRLCFWFFFFWFFRVSQKEEFLLCKTKMGVHGLISFMSAHGQHFESLKEAIHSRKKKKLLIDGSIWSLLLMVWSSFLVFIEQVRV
jgi:hypothetical protein